MILMFNDILGEEEGEEVIEEDRDSLIEALRYNVEKKEKIIQDLIRQVTELERQLENQNQTCVGI